jgi:hypothetical protein
MNPKLVLFWIMFVIVIGALMVNNHFKQKAERAAQKAETSRVQRVVKTAISQISERQNAITDWEEQLSKGERFRLSPILTIELEKLWQGERPILFIGSIKDISSANADQYNVLVEKSLYNNDYMFATELRLSLTAPKALIDSFLQSHPKLQAGDGFNNSVAVIAKIDSVNTPDERKVDGERVEAKTGQGRLFELIELEVAPIFQTIDPDF